MSVPDNALHELAALAGVVLTTDDLHDNLVEMSGSRRVPFRARTAPR